MAQADGVVANGTGSAVRSDINNQYAALWSNHSGSTEPSSGKVAYQLWADTNSGYLKIRNAANNSWIQLFKLDGTDICRLTGSTNNQITTVTGANAIQGEANLIFDGTNLGIGCTPSRELHVKGLDATVRLESTAATGRNVLEFYDSSAGKGSIGYPSSSNDHLAIQQSENANLYFTTNDLTRLTIDSSGRILIGTTTEGHAEGDDLTIATTGTTGITIRSGTGDAGNIFFSDATSGDAERQGILRYDHGDDAMKFSTNYGERLRILSGGGVTFNGDSAAANALDDYEFGSFTPAFNSNDNGGTFPVSTYIKVGRLVTISLHATVGGGSDSSGFKVTGLPFAPDKNGCAPVATDCNIACHCRIFDSQTYLEVRKFDATDVTYANLSDKFIMINATYRCNP